MLENDAQMFLTYLEANGGLWPWMISRLQKSQGNFGIFKGLSARFGWFTPKIKEDQFWTELI